MNVEQVDATVASDDKIMIFNKTRLGQWHPDLQWRFQRDDGHSIAGKGILSHRNSGGYSGPCWQVRLSHTVYIIHISFVHYIVHYDV